MEALSTFLSEWWPLVTIVVGVVISVINSATIHWQDMPRGWKRSLGFVIDLLSMLQSGGTPWKGEIKPPLMTTMHPKDGMR